MFYKASLSFLILILYVSVISAQDYQMIRSDRIACFEGSYIGIKCIRIDSVDFNGDSIFIPMSNIQYLNEYCVTPYAPSWTGEKVTIKDNGDHIFMNKVRDTIILKTKAILNDSWIVYEDSDKIVKASIVLHDTLSFLGITDSVKTIGFQVFNRAWTPIEHDLNNLEIIVSKSYGLVKTLNFYLFPDFKQMNYGFIDDQLMELKLSGLSSPELGTQNLTWFEVHDFQPGDELHISYDWSDWDFDYYRGTSKKTIKKYLDKADNGHSLEYIIERKQLTHQTWTDSSSVDFIHDTIVEMIDPNPYFDKLPGEPIISENNAYTNFQAGDYSKTIPPAYLHIMRNEDSCWSDCCYDGCYQAYDYLKGLGGPYGQCQNAFSGGGFEEKLVYFKKGEDTWGVPYVLTDVKKKELVNIEVCPNPATDNIWIKSSNGRIELLYLVEMTGKIMLRKNVGTCYYALNLNDINPGIYILVIKTDSGFLHKRIIVQ